MVFMIACSFTTLYLLIYAFAWFLFGISVATPVVSAGVIVIDVGAFIYTLYKEPAQATAVLGVVMIFALMVLMFFWLPHFWATLLFLTVLASCLLR